MKNLNPVNASAWATAERARFPWANEEVVNGCCCFFVFFFLLLVLPLGLVVCVRCLDGPCISIAIKNPSGVRLLNPTSGARARSDWGTSYSSPSPSFFLSLSFCLFLADLLETIERSLRVPYWLAAALKLPREKLDSPLIGRDERDFSLISPTKFRNIFCFLFSYTLCEPVSI